MTKLTPPPFLESERHDTDQSLYAERDKTNQSLFEARRNAERSTDEGVRAERVLTDRATTTSRSHGDADRADPEPLDAAAKAARAEGQLKDERRSADDALERERSAADAALVRERETKNAIIASYLERERGQTDESLSVERSRTDSEVNQATTMLSEEVAGHLRTQTSLTTRDEFSAIVSHDLRNPIGAIASCADMLLEPGHPNPPNAELRAWIEFIKRNADSSLRLISDLLDMERVAEGKLQLAFAKHDVGQIMREAIEGFALTASAKKISLRLKPKDTYGDIFCDRDRVAQVLSNLISNAIKFTPEGGSITLGTNWNDRGVEVSVHDTGPGIPADKIDKVFERFVQLGSRDRRGLGLGLHISSMLVEAHQGRLWVESKLGEGSSFVFTIPRQNPNGMH